MRMADFSVNAQPDGHPHLHPACASDVPKINDVAALPAEPFAEPTCNFSSRGFIIAAALTPRLSLHLPKCASGEHPFVQRETADAERILEVLIRAGTVAVD